MITGSVSPDGKEALVSVDLLSADHRSGRRVEAVIDTGFTDWLTLPEEVVRYLELPMRGSVEMMLADGRVQTLSMYRVRMVWHGREIRVKAYSDEGEASGEALVGMALLSGSRLTMDVVAGGEVRVEMFHQQSGGPG